jgi:long-chain fatty acid transport protein
MKRITWNHTRVLLLCSTVSSLSFGSGFQINEQSARSIGQAFSGRVSDADSASTIASNPAGLSRLTRAEISGGVAYIDAKSDISDASASNSLTGPTGGTNDGDMIPSITIPFIYYAQPIDDRWSAGIGVYVPFGLKTEYEDSFQGRYLGTTSEVELVTIQPTVSFKITPQLSFGLGITYNTIDGKLERNSIGFIPPATILTGVEAKVEGDDTAWGYNAGLLYELNDNTRFGLTYYSKVDYTLEGDTTIRNLGPTQKFDASLDVTTPDRVEFGLTHNLTQQLTLHANAGRTSWRKLEELVIENETANPLLARSVEELDWEDSWLYAVGLSYSINPQWTVRGGIAYDESPVPDSTRSVRVPVGDRVEYAMGVTWTPMENLSIDAAYLYFKERDSDVNATQASGPISYSYAAKYDNSANVFGLQMTYRM